MNIHSIDAISETKITTALLLAAGMGDRLRPLTSNSPKCLVKVNEKSFLERLVINLKKQGFKRLVVVTGHYDNCIREFLSTMNQDIIIDFIHSSKYQSTNNIYSLWMAREAIREPFLLVEGDLIFDVTLLDNMVYPDRIAISEILPWMNGTTVSINSSLQIKNFHKDTCTEFVKMKYKTVNIYSFSLASWDAIIKKLDQYISANKVNDYYEIVFAEMVAEGILKLRAINFDTNFWYEVDTIEDLREAEKLFAPEVSELALIENSSAIIAFEQIENETEKMNVALAG